MNGLKIYSAAELTSLTNPREGEIKLGQKVQSVSALDEIATSTAQFVLLGIPEDIGVRANHGIAGAASAWHPTLKALLNIQSTPFFKGDELLVLGHFTFSTPSEEGIPHLQQKVEEIDALVYPVIQKIVTSGKIPIVIGGGHNNAYPIIKGTSMALNRPIDVINIDAHADLRPTTGRHSGNGFSYAIKDDFLTRYGIFGLHQNYNNNAILETIAANQHIYPVFFDDLLKGDQSVFTAWANLLKKTGTTTGLELDLDCIENLLSSAMTPSGFTLNEIRRLILTSTKKFTYLHICEGAVALTDGRSSQSTPKTITYLISDFIKSQK
ncbi:MAG: formimidoylglutamase [Candidatus Pedobacter colombiensis]|uniref:Formimidoylglutamase n=1 Tax=Candidatus Pedobacter colombiensis TaxID=3121371 RepID=A0AAJ5WAL6_9SPHI|nr:formimidoylglutamase [Pedobacter sp.]WEK19302.1 MAG: formimidoylglutamase [Pedobacter sp.]